MALTQKLELRQGQSLVMTPQLQQAIKLLQLSNMDLDIYVATELEKNPLLERGPEGYEDAGTGLDTSAAHGESGAPGGSGAPGEGDPNGDEKAPTGADEWLETGGAAADPAAVLDTDYDNIDPDSDVQKMPSDHKMSWDLPLSGPNGSAGNDVNLEEFVTIGVAPGEGDPNGDEKAPTGADEWLETGGAAADPAAVLDTDYDNIDPDSDVQKMPSDHKMSWDLPLSGPNGSAGNDVNLEAFVTKEVSLRDHLLDQLKMTFMEPVQTLIGEHIIDMIDEAGYVRGDLNALADRLGVELDFVEEILEALQKFEPCGVFARSLNECLTLQLKDKNRFDPQIAIVLDNLDLLASHKLPDLKRIARASDEDLADIVAEIKGLNPKPGLQFGSISVQPVVPDVIVKQRSDGSWHVELNSETLPRVLVNQIYYTSVSASTTKNHEKSYINECLQSANWLVKSLDQRARTILKVAQEIVRQQDAFLTYGVQHLRPLNLKTVADAISMHESTVSRVTSNKYMETNRGIFELKYFFTSSIASAGAGDAHSSESVRYEIKKLIDNETVSTVLSDDKIVDKLKQQGIDIARRTVAKYRESMRIPSSVQRRREKRLVHLNET